jgi:hypothetical protein
MFPTGITHGLALAPPTMPALPLSNSMGLAPNLMDITTCSVVV